MHRAYLASMSTLIFLRACSLTLAMVTFSSPDLSSALTPSLLYAAGRRSRAYITSLAALLFSLLGLPPPFCWSQVVFFLMTRTSSSISTVRSSLDCPGTSNHSCTFVACSSSCHRSPRGGTWFTRTSYITASNEIVEYY
uniref:Secreted protein n=1 Tax=Arundo donax TaxID=35708 RepID=A0A0A9DF47_ARUDO